MVTRFLSSWLATLPEGPRGRRGPPGWLPPLFIDDAHRETDVDQHPSTDEGFEVGIRFADASQVDCPLDAAHVDQPQMLGGIGDANNFTGDS